MNTAGVPTRPGRIRIEAISPAKAALTLVGAVWIALAALGPNGLFTIDELIYLGASEAFAEDFSMFVENGHERFGSEALRLWFLVAGPNGLAPQYPSGYPILAAPAFAIFGAPGMMLLNVGAAIGTLFLSHRLAMRLFADPVAARAAVLILGLASFLGDYAVGIWPHAISTLIVVAATLFASEAVLGGAEHGRDRRFALAAGAVVGLGVLVRLDTVLVLPSLLIWALVVAPRPLRLVPTAIIGTLPGLALATALNFWKFDVLSPFSYGPRNGGGEDPSSYLALAGLMAAVAGASVLLRSAAARHRAAVPGLIGLVAAIGIVLIVPALRDLVVGYLRGLYILLVDLRLSADARPGIIRGEDGSVSFWGIPKKALGQSLPWLGILVLVATRRWNPPERYGVALLALIATLWFMPFARTEWHGGFGSNMRYFLPVVPHLAILAAVAWRRMEAEIEGDMPFRTVLRRAVRVVAVPFMLVMLLFGTDGMEFLQHWLPPILLLALSVAALPVPFGGKAAAWSAGACRALFAATLCYACFLSVLDLKMNQSGRSQHATLTEAAFREVPADSLIYTVRPETFPFQLIRERAFLANAPLGGPVLDGPLIRSALGDGLRVFVHGDALVSLVARYSPDLRAERFIEAADENTLWEIRPGRARGQEF